MKPADYLDALKHANGITSDYALAKLLDLKAGWLPAIRRDERALPLETAYKIAIGLNLDPAAVVADLESQREKNPKRQEFWRGFLSRAAIPVILACTLALSFIGDFGDAVRVNGGAMIVKALQAIRRAFGAYNLYYVKFRLADPAISVAAGI